MILCSTLLHDIFGWLTRTRIMCGSIHVASKVVWSLISIVGCGFHLTRSRWKRVQNLWLRPYYIWTLTQNLKMTSLNSLCLSLQPSSEVKDYFIKHLMSIKPIWLDYLVDTYISSSSTFPPSLWTMNSIDSKKTT